MLILEKLRKQQVDKDLNLILTSWNWQGKNFTSAQEFLQKMKPWIEERLKQQEEVKEFKKKWKIKKLSEIKGIQLE